MASLLGGRAPKLLGEQDGVLSFDDGTVIPRDKLGSASQWHQLAASPVTPLSQRPDAVLDSSQLAAKRGGLDAVPDATTPSAPTTAPEDMPWRSHSRWDPKNDPRMVNVNGVYLPRENVAKVDPNHPALAQQQEGPAEPPKPATTGAAGPAMGTTTETTTQTQKGFKLGQKEREGLNSAYDAQGKAIQNAANVGAEQAAAEAAHMRETDAQLAQKDADDRLREQTRQVEQDNQMSKVEAAKEKFKSLKLDDSKWWTSKSAPAKIATGLGMLLSGLGVAAAGGKNLAMESMDDEMNRSLALQKDEMANAREGVNLENNMLSQLRQQGLDERQADLAARSMMIESLQRKLQITAAQYKSPEIQARAQAGMAELQSQKAATDAALAKDAADKSTIITQRKTAPIGGQVSPQLSFEMDKDKRERAVRLPDGSTALAPTPKAAQDIQASDETRMAMQSNISRLKDLVANGTSLSGDTRDEVKRISNDLLTQYGVMRKLGALSDSDRELAEQFRDPNAFFTRDAKIIKSLDAYQQRIDNGHTAMLKSRLVL